MNREEFYEYVSNENNADRIASAIDIGSMHIGMNAMILELINIGHPKTVEAIQFMEDNKIQVNSIIYPHVKV